MSDADTAMGFGPVGGSRSAGPDDAEAVFEAMQARLDELLRLPVVRSDGAARALLDDMARAAAMEDIVALLDQLDARVSLLLRRRGMAPSSSVPRERPPRTLLRL